MWTFSSEWVISRGIQKGWKGPKEVVTFGYAGESSDPVLVVGIQVLWRKLANPIACFM